MLNRNVKTYCKFECVLQIGIIIVFQQHFALLLLFVVVGKHRLVRRLIDPRLAHLTKNTQFRAQNHTNHAKFVQAFLKMVCFLKMGWEYWLAALCVGEASNDLRLLVLAYEFVCNAKKT